MMKANWKNKIGPLLAVVLGLAGPLQAKEGAVQCGNLIYAGTKTSKCFSDEFLSTVQKKTSISTERRFKPVKMSSEELFQFPFVVMTGEGDFTLTRREREHMKKYLENGGFLLGSASCSNEAWGRSFERELKRMFGADTVRDVAMDHPLFRTIFEVKELKLAKSSGESKLRGVTLNGKLVVAYSLDGLNDTSHTEGCCCCGGNEIQNSLQLNANILAYALLH